MLHSQSRLVKFGLELLRNADKMKKTLQFFMKKYPHDLAGWVIARRIEEELNLTSWNLSSSYLHSTTSNGRIMIHGIGDPSNGFGALNYIKMPLKARGEKEEKTNNMMKVG